LLLKLSRVIAPLHGDWLISHPVDAKHITQHWKRDHGRQTSPGRVLLYRYHPPPLHNNSWEILRDAQDSQNIPPRWTRNN
jgi:hypothetical protein